MHAVSLQFSWPSQSASHSCWKQFTLIPSASWLEKYSIVDWCFIIDDCLWLVICNGIFLRGKCFVTKSSANARLVWTCPDLSSPIYCSLTWRQWNIWYLRWRLLSAFSFCSNLPVLVFSRLKSREFELSLTVKWWVFHTVFTFSNFIFNFDSFGMHNFPVVLIASTGSCCFFRYKLVRAAGKKPNDCKLFSFVNQWVQ